MTKDLKELFGEFRSVGTAKGTTQCLLFVCPVCPCGHGILVNYTAPALYSSGAVWTKTGTGIDDVSLTPSINCNVPSADGTPSNCKFHGWVTAGKVIW